MAIPHSIQLALNDPYELTPDQIEFFQQNRFIKLKQVLDTETVNFFSEVITVQVNKMNKVNTSLDDRDTYGKAFLQLFNLWREDENVKQLVFSKRIAKIAAELMQVKGV